MSDCKVIALCNQKGGVVKTTACVNLGIGLAQRDKRVFLIDLDAQASMTLSGGYTFVSVILFKTIGISTVIKPTAMSGTCATTSASGFIANVGP